jgi:hypothetical protein
MTRGTTKTTKANPAPEELLAKAEALPSKVKLSEYWDTVTLLREKDYSWREIAAWLNEQGLGVHYKQLERYDKKRDALGSDVDADEEN